MKDRFHRLLALVAIAGLPLFSALLSGSVSASPPAEFAAGSGGSTRQAPEGAHTPGTKGAGTGSRAGKSSGGTTGRGSGGNTNKTSKKKCYRTFCDQTQRCQLKSVPIPANDTCASHNMLDTASQAQAICAESECTAQQYCFSPVCIKGKCNASATFVPDGESCPAGTYESPMDAYRACALIYLCAGNAPAEPGHTGSKGGRGPNKPVDGKSQGKSGGGKTGGKSGGSKARGKTGGKANSTSGGGEP